MTIVDDGPARTVCSALGTSIHDALSQLAKRVGTSRIGLTVVAHFRT